MILPVVVASTSFAGPSASASQRYTGGAIMPAGNRTWRPPSDRHVLEKPRHRAMNESRFRVYVLELSGLETPLPAVLS